MAETITADMIIHDIVTNHPATVKVFHGHGLPCTACAVGSRESVAGGARTHRFTPEKQAILLKDLKRSLIENLSRSVQRRLRLGGGGPWPWQLPVTMAASNRLFPSWVARGALGN